MYCNGNPYKYTDPSGNNPLLIAMGIGALVGGIINWWTHGHEFSLRGLGYFGAGAAVGALSALGGAAGAAAIGASGLAAGVGVGAFIGGTIGTGTSLLLNGCNNMLGGGNFGDNFAQSFWSGMVGGAISGGISGGIVGYNNALKAGKNVWWGGESEYDVQFSAGENVGNKSTTTVSEDELPEYAKKNFGKRLPQNNIVYRYSDLNVGKTNQVNFGLAGYDKGNDIWVLIPRKYANNPDMLYLCMDHEIVHVNDFASGRMKEWMDAYNSYETARNMTEVRAYSRSIRVSNEYFDGKYIFNGNSSEYIKSLNYCNSRNIYPLKYDYPAK